MGGPIRGRIGRLVRVVLLVCDLCCRGELEGQKEGIIMGNAKTIREFWSRSRANALMITGVLGGVAVSTFSKTLAMLFGLLVFGVQVCRRARQKKRKDRQC